MKSFAASLRTHTALAATALTLQAVLPQAALADDAIDDIIAGALKSGYSHNVIFAKEITGNGRASAHTSINLVPQSNTPKINITIGVTDPVNDVVDIYVGTVANPGKTAQATPSPEIVHAPGAYAIALGDFNKDGILDMAVTNKFSNTVGIYIGNSDGTTFQAATNYIVGATPYSIASADMNGDSYADLIVGNFASKTATVLYSSGPGTFSNETTVNTGANPVAICAGLFKFKSQSGFVDFVVVNQGDNTISSFVNNTQGGFVSAGTAATGKGPTACASGDFNRDGNMDVAVANGDGTVSVLLGNGDGTFKPMASYPVGAAAAGIATASLAGTSYLDLAVSGSDGNVYLLGGRGDGTFVAAVKQNGGGGALTSINAVDLNGDGSVDLMVFDTTNLNVNELLNQVVSVAPQTGWWFNPNEGGRGYTIERAGNNLFMASYLYAASGATLWYGISGTFNGSSYTGQLTSYDNGQTLTGNWQPATQLPGSAGNVSITFTSPTQGMMTWPEGTIPLVKYDFGPGGSATVQPAGTPEPGWWWAPTEGGRGYSFEIQGNQMFLAGYMYDSNGNPIWYASGPTAMSTFTTYQSPWEQYGNGQTLTGTWHLPTIITTFVGPLTIQFNSTTTGTLTLPTGRQVAIERFRF